MNDVNYQAKRQLQSGCGKNSEIQLTRLAIDFHE